MEANVDPLFRGPDWMPITPKRGSFLHANSQALHQRIKKTTQTGFLPRRRQSLTMRGRTPTSSAIERVLPPSAAGNTMSARFTSRLRCRRCPAASLNHLAYLRLEPDLSCVGNHPDLKSRGHGRLCNSKKNNCSFFSRKLSRGPKGHGVSSRQARYLIPVEPSPSGSP